VTEARELKRQDSFDNVRELKSGASGPLDPEDALDAIMSAPTQTLKEMLGEGRSRPGSIMESAI